MNAAFKQMGVVSKLASFTLDLERRVYKPDESDVGIRVLKTMTALVIMLLAACAIIALWQMPFLLACALCLLALIKRLVFPIKWELLWFLIVGGMGAYAESLIIQTGGAWTYANPQFFGIPIWLPAIWGLTATALMTAYAAVTGGVRS